MGRHSTTLGAVGCALAAAALVSGCGGGSSSGTPDDNRPTGGGGLNGISLANCLTDENWLVAPSEGQIEGLSPAGAPVTVQIFASAGAAKSVAAGKAHQRTAGRAVVSFQAEATSSNLPDEPGKVDPAAVRIVAACVNRLDAG
jgi:hypothetical protein